MYKRIIPVLIFLFITVFFLHADVIRMKDGNIYIGRVYTVNQEGVILLVNGEKITVQYENIIQADPDFRNVKDRNLEVTLKDNSTMLGKVQDYDADIGLLMEIDFGIITVPPENIKSIMDYEQRGKQLAHTLQIGGSAGYYFTVGDLADVFGNNFKAQVFGEYSLGFLLEGLFAGGCLSYIHASSAAYTSYSFLLFDIEAYAMYRLLLLRSQAGFLRNIVPFGALGAGAAVPVRTANGVTAVEVSVSFSGTLGVDYFISDTMLIRISGKWLTILQSQLWFNAVSADIGIAVCF